MKAHESVKKLSVCAVMVSFNRKKLLVRGLNALQRQTRPVDKIIIIDNASTDGTPELLKSEGFLDKKNIQFQQLTENLGGAGGFKTGVELAYQQGFDWIWMMDDDGYPTDDCLCRLLEYKDDYDFYGPLVLSDEDKENFSFPMTLPKSKKVIRSKPELMDFLEKEKKESKILNDILIPFNGVLINKESVRKIGFPDARFFIWGDDIEYTKRLQRQGGKIATISNIEFYHPTAPNLGTPMFFGRMQFNDTDSKIKLYCLCRNNTFNLKKYHGSLYALMFFLKTIWFYSFTKPSFKKLVFCIPALIHGWIENFSFHKLFMNSNF